MSQIVCQYCKATYTSFQNKCNECGAPILPSAAPDAGEAVRGDSGGKRRLWLSLGAAGSIIGLVIGIWVAGENGRSGVEPELSKTASTVYGGALDSEPGARSWGDSGAQAVGANAPIPPQFDHQLHAVDAAFRPYYQRAMLANRIAALMPFRIMLNEYYMVTGKFPGTEHEFIAEFGPDSLAADEDFTRFSVLDNGGLQGHLAPPFEDGEYVALIPEVSKRGSTINWKCRTNLPQSAVGPRSGAICVSLPAGESPLAGSD